MVDYSLDRGVRKAAKRGDRARSSTGDESAESRTIVRLRVERSKGSKASRNIAAYFYRSGPNQPSHSANARTRSLGTEDSLSVMMYSTVCPGRSFTPAAEELLCCNRSDTNLLVITWQPRDSLADDEFRNVHISAGKAFFVTRQYGACGLELVKIGIKIVSFGEDCQYLVLHSFQQGRCVVAPAFQAANLQFTILRDGEEAIGHRHIGNLSRRKKYDMAVHGLDREREASFVLTRLG